MPNVSLYIDYCLCALHSVADCGGRPPPAVSLTRTTILILWPSAQQASEKGMTAHSSTGKRNIQHTSHHQAISHSVQSESILARSALCYREGGRQSKLVQRHLALW